MYVRGSFHGTPDDLSETIHDLQSMAQSAESWTDTSALYDAIEYLDEIMDAIDYV